LAQLKDLPLEPIVPPVAPAQPVEAVAEAVVAEAEADLGPVEREPEVQPQAEAPLEPAAEDFNGIVQPENVIIDLPDVEEGTVLGPEEEAPPPVEAQPTQIVAPQPSPPLPPADEQQISRPPPPASSPAEAPETSRYSGEESLEQAPLPAPRNSPPESADTHSAESHNANNLYPANDSPDLA
jgi:hypothetical protein